MTILWLVLVTAAESYLLGGIDAGILVSKFLLKDDVRAHGSGNVGMTNMLRTYGKLPAALTALGDGLKGALAVLIAEKLFAAYVLQTGIAPLCGGYLAFVFAALGHMYPIYFKFKGGKGVMVTAGCMLVLNLPVALALFAIFCAIVAVTGMVSLGSVVIAVLIPLFTAGYGLLRHWTMQNILVSALCCAIIAVIVIYKHGANLERIKNGTEYRFGKKHNGDNK